MALTKMIRASILLYAFSFILVIPSVGQTYITGWKYQLELQQVPDGHIEISYSKKALIPDWQLSGNSESGSPQFQIARHTAMGNLMMPANTNNGNGYPLNPEYFHSINKNLPPVIKLPETTYKKGFPDPTKNQFYPTPDGN